jgi:hypothetical protein
MQTPLLASRRTLLRLGVALATAAVVGTSAAWSPAPVKLAQLDVYDRTSGAALPVYEKDGRHYIVGVPGHEYAVRIRNCTGNRILAVTSVDGVNVISGDTASPDQSGYVIEPWGSVEIGGWRKSMSRTAAFFFTEHSNSYAARTGRPFDVGVIGVAVFAEKVERQPMRMNRDSAFDKAEQSAAAPAAAPPPASPPAATAGTAGPLAQVPREEAGVRERRDAAKLGTGHGRSETSYVRHVAFERATASPGQLLSIQYDRYENLLALGVLPQPQIARREPQPFPGLRFAPDPR